MPRNSSGTMSAPAGQPAVSGTVISSSVFNALVADLIAELTDSLSRSGKGPMTAPLKTPDGSVSAPAHSFTSEAGTGWYRAAAGDLRLSIAGVDIISFKNNTITLLVGPNPQILATGSNTAISILGNRNAADVNPDTVIGSTAVRTAGLLTYFQNGGTNKLGVDYQGLLSLVSQAAPLQPASIWTAITPNTNWSTLSGLAYWKDAGGLVHIKGSATSAVGATADVFTLPVGFRPLATRLFAVEDNGGGFGSVTVASSGIVSIRVGFVAGHFYGLDPISFLAEQ